MLGVLRKIGPLLIVLASLGVYVGSYRSLLAPEGERPWDAQTGRVEARYRLQGETAETLFTPVHWVDRKLRPDVWQREPANCVCPL